jgi:AraC family transcriptional regulator of arabinose operon
VVSKTIAYMQQKINTPVKLEEIAASVNISASHFSAIFKSKTGHSPIEYFNQLKIQKACQYLSFTNMAVKEIAINLGIEDQYYFSRMFTKLMGISPTKYRGKNQAAD